MFASGWGSAKFSSKVIVENIALFLICALLAHSVEHFHGKEEVAGSIPAEGS